MRGPGWPSVTAGMTIGLLGGSFDPAHEGHVRVTMTALHRFGLDRVWWLVSSGNPLKVHGPAPLARRMACARRMMDHPAVTVTDLEARLGTRHTAQTLKALRRQAPGVRFTWLMGADNLAQFHRWDDWRDILHAVPVGIVARPGQGLRARRSVAARAFARWRIAPQAARLLARSDPPAWCFVDMPLRPESSTRLREDGGWGAGACPSGRG